MFRALSGHPSSDQRSGWAVLSVTTIGSLLTALDANIVSIALPKMAQNISNSISLIGWVITGYILALASCVILSGKIGDSFGKKRIYLIGFAVFGISSTLCGLTFSTYQIIAWRVVQGLSASILTANGLPLLFEAFPSNKRGMAIGINGMSWAFGAIFGPIFGGMLVTIDWRLIFFINLPISLIAVFAGIKRIPDDKPVDFSTNISKLNPLSSILLLVAVALTIISLTFFSLTFLLAGIVGFLTLKVNCSMGNNLDYACLTCSA